MLSLHKRVSGTWHLCHDDNTNYPDYGYGCHYAIDIRSNRCDIIDGKLIYHDYPYDTIRKYPIVHLNQYDILAIIDDMNNENSTHGKINGYHICDVCMRNVTSIAERIRNSMIDYSKPFVIDPDNGRLYQESPRTLANAKKLAKRLAQEYGDDYVVCKPHATFGPVKPKIVEIKH